MDILITMAYTALMTFVMVKVTDNSICGGDGGVSAAVAFRIKRKGV